MVQDTHPTYDIFQLFFETADTGHAGAARDRTYLLMSHHDKTSCKFDPMTMKDIIPKRMRQKVQTRPSDYFMATWMEVENEAQQLAAKRKVPYVEDCRDCCRPIVMMPQEQFDGAVAATARREDE